MAHSELPSQGQTGKKTWVAPEITGVPLRDIGRRRSPLTKTGTPDPILPPLLMKDTGATDIGKPGGVNTKPSGNQDFGVKGWS